MIALDACVLIAHFSTRDPHAERALNILDTEEELVIHPLNLGEVLVGPARSSRAQRVMSAVESLGVMEIDMEAGQPLELAQLRARFGLRLPDCCVLAAALTTRASVATFDKKLARAARELGLEVVDG